MLLFNLYKKQLTIIQHIEYLLYVYFNINTMLTFILRQLKVIIVHTLIYTT